MRIDYDSRQQHKTIFTVHHHQYSFIPITICDQRGKQRENGTWHTNADHWQTLAIHLFVLKLIVQFNFLISIYIFLLSHMENENHKTTHRTCEPMNGRALKEFCRNVLFQFVSTGAANSNLISVRNHSSAFLFNILLEEYRK